MSNCKVMRERWRRWLKRINTDLIDVLIAKHIYQEIGRIVLANEDIQRPGDVHDWISRCYGTTAVVGVRRLTDKRTDSVSLVRLLSEIREHPDAITRESHVCRYQPRLRGAGSHWFDEFAGAGRNTLPRSVPARHLRDLRQAEHRIRRVVDTQIAHLDQENRQRKPVTFQEVHDAIDIMDRIVVSYNLLLTGSSPQPSLVPTWTHDLCRVFYQAWVKNPPPGWQHWKD